MSPAPIARHLGHHARNFPPKAHLGPPVRQLAARLPHSRLSRQGAKRAASAQQDARGLGQRAGSRALVLAGGEELDLRVALDREVQVHA